MSIYGLGLMRTIDTRFVDAFREAADEISQQTFDLTFTHATSFGGNALVLTVDEARSRPVQDLAEALRRSLHSIGLKVPVNLPTIKPHITLTDKAPKVERHPIEPLRLTVNSFTLVDSVYGETKHIALGLWPLVPR